MALLPTSTGIAPPLSNFVGVDPGRHAAVAFVSGGWLQCVRKWDPDVEPFPFGSVAGCLAGVERPQDRPGKRQASVNDLIALGIRAGKAHQACAERFSAVQWVAINRWKGSLPKEVSHKRIADALYAYERTIVVGISGDEWDAVGIALYLAGRNPCRVP